MYLVFMQSQISWYLSLEKKKSNVGWCEKCDSWSVS
jgi:hypothetical protein